MELSPGWVSAGAAIAGLIGGALIRWVDGSITAVKNTQKTLFEKLDERGREFQDYRVHVAEIYVAEAKLEKLLDPLARRLESIEDGLREDRRAG